VDSALARQGQEALVDAARRMSPEERLNAFLEHSQLMAALYLAGRAFRAQKTKTRSA